ncbi:hypothetical protein EYF80_048190 [Liparis tanakae]|uniref:Uncharacterized protein n=1 Tax=Liparis tanakae TaxID=230148 RepID=A0A4Z2FL69_9TELE|nr:hypothetical protein EYF80_048190 [Liparis tanakae]
MEPHSSSSWQNRGIEASFCPAREKEVRNVEEVSEIKGARERTFFITFSFFIKKNLGAYITHNATL